MFIRPALDPEGSDGARLRVRDPETMAFLADGGEEKPASEYWLRRLVEGGVEERVNGQWPLPPGDNTLKQHPGTGVEMTEVKPGPDGVTVFEGEAPVVPPTPEETAA